MGIQPEAGLNCGSIVRPGRICSQYKRVLEPGATKLPQRADPPSDAAEHLRNTTSERRQHQHMSDMAIPEIASRAAHWPKRQS
jgi:hypothetical protein